MNPAVKVTDSARHRRGSGSADGSSAVTIDSAMLQRAVEQAQAAAERERFLAMKPGEVLRSAEELINSRSDLGKARKMLEAGKTITGVGSVRYQACDDKVCYRPASGSFVFEIRP